MNDRCEKILIPLGLFLFVLTIAGTAGADGGIYKWVDAEGRTHYGDQPRSNRVEKVELDQTRRIQVDESRDDLRTPSADRKKALEDRLERARRVGRQNTSPESERRAAIERVRAQAGRDPNAEEGWRKRAIESCKSGGFRENCESEKEIWKRRPLPQWKRDKRKEKRAKRLRRR